MTTSREQPFIEQEITLQGEALVLVFEIYYISDWLMDIDGDKQLSNTNIIMSWLWLLLYIL